MSLDVFAMHPVNGSAKSILSQKGVDAVDRPLTNEEMKTAIKRLREQREPIALKLGITNARQKKNFMYRFNTKNRSTRGYKKDRDAALEYIRLGQAIETFTKILAERKAEERG